MGKSITIRKIGKFNFEDYARKSPAVKRKVTKLATAKAENFFKNHFDASGFIDNSLKKWKRSQRAERGEGKTLVDTGSLRNSILTTQMSFKRSKVESTGLAYASIHNKGGRAGRNRATLLPQRKFLGNSALLERETNIRIYRREFRKII